MPEVLAGATTKVIVKSAWLSKINWTQGVASAAMLATLFGVPLDAETQANILAGIIGIQSLITWVLKTFVPPSVTPSSVST